MSSIFQGLVTNGRLRIGAGPTTHHFRSVPLNANNEIVVGEGPITLVAHGIPYNAAGEVVGLTSTQATRHGSGATPYGPNGEIEGRAEDYTHIYQGIPYTTGGVYAGSGAPGPSIVAKEFFITPAQFAATAAGYRFNPAAGSLTPDRAYGGGNISTINATDSDFIVVTPDGGAPFPGITGNLTMQLPAYVGPNRIVLPWDVNTYLAQVPGIYAYMQSLIGFATSLRLAAAPA